MNEPRAFVTGWPIAHSRSPLIHGHWLAERGLAGTYEAIAVAPEDFAAFLGGLRERGLSGGNVTIPHKEEAFARLGRRDPAAEAIGAVNTMWFERDQLVGGNTDAYGFAANLDEQLAGWRDAGHAAVLGAGGSARAVVHALAEAGVRRVTILNRTAERAEALAARFGAGVTGGGEDRTAAVLASCDLLVNTRPPAAQDGRGTGAALPDISGLAPSALVADIVYVPLRTPLLEAAAARGLRTADGLGMLLHQAVPGFERWFGVRPAVTAALRDLVLADIAAREKRP